MPDQTTYTITSEQLARLLQTHPSSIRAYRAGLRRQPILLGLPEPIQAQPRLVWLRADIEAWLDSRRTFLPEPASVTTPRPGRGRPRKTTKAARAAGGAV